MIVQAEIFFCVFAFLSLFCILIPSLFSGPSFTHSSNPGIIRTHLSCASTVDYTKNHQHSKLFYGGRRSKPVELVNSTKTRTWEKQIREGGRKAFFFSSQISILDRSRSSLDYFFLWEKIKTVGKLRRKVARSAEVVEKKMPANWFSWSIFCLQRSFFRFHVTPWKLQTTQMIEYHGHFF